MARNAVYSFKSSIGSVSADTHSPGIVIGLDWKKVDWCISSFLFCLFVFYDTFSFVFHHQRYNIVIFGGIDGFSRKVLTSVNVCFCFIDLWHVTHV